MSVSSSGSESIVAGTKGVSHLDPVQTSPTILREISIKESETKMKLGYLFPIAIIVAGVALLIWFIASGAYIPGS